jgi:deoxyribose-phosphate aldolase
MVVDGKAEIEAAGGISKFQQVQDMMHAGATRIGTADAVKIIKDFFKWEAE